MSRSNSRRYNMEAYFVHMTPVAITPYSHKNGLHYARSNIPDPNVKRVTLYKT